MSSLKNCKYLREDLETQNQNSDYPLVDRNETSDKSQSSVNLPSNIEKVTRY